MNFRFAYSVKHVPSSLFEQREKSKCQAQEDAERQRQDRELQMQQEEEERQLRKKVIDLIDCSLYSELSEAHSVAECRCVSAENRGDHEEN